MLKTYPSGNKLAVLHTRDVLVSTLMVTLIDYYLMIKFCCLSTSLIVRMNIEEFSAIQLKKQ